MSPSRSQCHTGAADLASANADHWDAVAGKYDVPAAIDLHMKTLLPVWLKSFDFDPQTTTVLDFACGTGLVSRGLAPHAAKFVGIDISQGMVKQYNAVAKELGYPIDKVHAVSIELKGAPGELDDVRFDVAICCMAYHHIEALAETTAALTHFLKPGGVLLVVDQMPWTNEGKAPYEKYRHIFAHPDGFEEATMRELFQGAGLKQFEYGKVTQFEWEGVTQHLFLARGVKV